MDKTASIEGINKKGCAVARWHKRAGGEIALGVIASTSYDAAQVIVSPAELRLFAGLLLEIADAAETHVAQSQANLEAMIGG